MKVALLLSGGVDSAVTLHLLREQGHDVHLFYIRIGMEGDGGDCAAEEDLEMCRLIARRYGLPLDVVDLHREYWDTVMEYALQAVREGLTPNPDMMCNRMVKFGYFEQRHGHLFDRTATGHYATIVERDGKRWLGTAVDPVKDQTDFLARITYPQLCHAMFPLGHLPKEEVRRLAATLHLPNAERRDSQGICFLGKINYNDFLRTRLGERPGDIVDIDSGRILGRHRGYWFHTIGQRKGLGLSGGPWYVVDKNVADNVVYVSGGYDTPRQYGTELTLEGMHWITECPFPDLSTPAAVLFKNRHMPAFLPGELSKPSLGDRYILNSASPVQGIAPGQFAVLYSTDKSICYGSAQITN